MHVGAVHKVEWDDAEIVENVVAALESAEFPANHMFVTSNGENPIVEFDTKGKKVREFTEVELRCIVLGVARGVAHLHKAGIIHRDIKLENIAFLNESKTIIKV